ncbi:hypothetical protein LJC49_03250 [Ruminococcaceae bacterium OttesenSCG-928-I18]|nr:hypothetical protein [Ruminococcaceae bacterium OttesenSCG-928-I18]
MPDSYTHVNIALQALLRGGQAVASLPCYIAGANGPDPFHMYQFWRRNRQPDLSALADRIHREQTGRFLAAMLDLAITPEQQSYTMGFLTHYTTDCTLYPYIAALGDAGFFKGKRERLQFEASIDSELFYGNYRTRTVPLYAATPMLLTDDLGQVTQLLHESLLATYGVDIPVVDLADAFHDNVSVRKAMISPRGVKKTWAKLVAPLRTGSKNAMPMLARFQPGKPLPPLPEKWKNPYSGEEMHLRFEEVILLAEQTAAAAVVAAMRYWLGEIDGAKLLSILGDNNYYTGQPNPPPGTPARADAKPEKKDALPERAAGGPAPAKQPPAPPTAAAIPSVKGAPPKTGYRPAAPVPHATKTQAPHIPPNQTTTQPPPPGGHTKGK